MTINTTDSQQCEVTLEPCPFCGAGAGDVPLSRGHGFIIGCSSCQAQQFAMERTDAIKAWNSRATVVAPPVEQMTDQELAAAIEFHKSEAERFTNEVCKLWRFRIRGGIATDEDKQLMADLTAARAASPITAPSTTPNRDDGATVDKFLATIADGLRHAIRDHGPITKEWIGSAAKRVWGRIKGTKYDPFKAVASTTPVDGEQEKR